MSGEPLFRVILPDGRKTKLYTREKIAAAVLAEKIPRNSSIDMDGLPVPVTDFCDPEALRKLPPMSAAAAPDNLRMPPASTEEPVPVLQPARVVLPKAATKATSFPIVKTIAFGAVIVFILLLSSLLNSDSVKPKTSSIDPTESLAAFKTRLVKMEAESFISNLSVRKHTCTLQVHNDWHYQPYQIRLQVTQNLWKIWASCHYPTNPDQARIKIVDHNGNEVAGSRIFGGSLIWAQEN